MPRIPTYQSNLGVPKGSSNYLINERTFMPVVRAGAQIGNVLQQRGEQLLEEYDTTRSVGAYNKFRDASRAKVTELLQREGASAQGVQSEYEDWYRKTSERISKDELTVARQNDMYKEMADRSRASDLDSLAGHEARQHSAYKKEVLGGMAETMVRDVADVAFDDAKQDAMLSDYFNRKAQLYPGHDLTESNLSDLEAFRVSAAKTMITENPEYASKWIDKHKKELGGSYDGLKKSLAGVEAKNRIDAVTTVLFNKHITNPEAAVGEVLNPNNHKAWGISSKDAAGIASYFRGMISDRDKAEQAADNAHKDEMDKNEMNYLISLYDPNVKSRSIHELGRTGKVSKAFYEKMAKPAAVNEDYVIIDELENKSDRGILTKEDVEAAVSRGSITTKTAGRILKENRNEELKQARFLLKTALAPSQYDARFQDKNLKLREALELFNAKASSGMPWGQAKDEVISLYTGDIRRQKKNLGRPKYLTQEAYRDALTEIEALEFAERRTVSAFAAGTITAQEYKTEIDLIEKRKDFARYEQQIIDTSVSDETRKKKVNRN